MDFPDCRIFEATHTKALLCGDFWGYSSKTVGGCHTTTLISCVDDLLRQDYLVKKS